MSAAPVFYTTPRVVSNTANFAAASTGRGLTGGTGLVDVATGAATGSRINRVTVMHNKDTSTPTATGAGYGGTRHKRSASRGRRSPRRVRRAAHFSK